jgi:AraC-like DNA-binding protein
MDDLRFDMLRRPASPALSSIVTELILYRESFSGAMRQREPASLVVPLIIGFAAPFGIGLGGRPGANERYVSFAAGLYCGHVEIESAGGCHCLQINFTPWGAHAVLGVPMHELTGTLVDPMAILGGRFHRLREHLGEECDWPKRLDLAEAFISERVHDAARRPSAALWAYRRLIESGGTERIGTLARATGWSRKHLNRMFREEFGLGPKAIARIVRFNRALAMAHEPQRPSWAGIAHDCGYSDQSHLVRDFTELAGETPRAALH